MQEQTQETRQYMTVTQPKSASGKIHLGKYSRIPHGDGVWWPRAQRYARGLPNSHESGTRIKLILQVGGDGSNSPKVTKLVSG